MYKEYSQTEKDQFIVAFFPNFEKPEVAISYAVALAKMLGKSLILLHIIDPRYKNNETLESAKKKLLEISQKLNFPQNMINTLVLQGRVNLVLERSEELANVICLVSHVGEKNTKTPASPNQLFKNFQNIRMAYILVQKSLKNSILFNNIVLTLDIEKESKEKVIWASYFGRFNQSKIHLLHYNFHDSFLQRRLSNNLLFVEKMLDNLNVNYEIKNFSPKNKSIDSFSIPYLKEHSEGLVISLADKKFGLLSLFTGRRKEKLATNTEQFPVLFLNPREDIYILCD